MKRIPTLLAGLLLAVGLASTDSAAAEERTPIHFGAIGWESGALTTEILRLIVEHGFGYPTDTLPGSTVSMEVALARNDLQVAQELFARRSLGLFEALRVVDANLVDLAVHVLGNDVIAASWFTSRNLHFSQRAPMEMLVVGDRQAVVNELLRLEHGVY